MCHYRKLINNKLAWCGPTWSRVTYHQEYFRYHAVPKCFIAPFETFVCLFYFAWLFQISKGVAKAESRSSHARPFDLVIPCVHHLLTSVQVELRTRSEVKGQPWMWQHGRRAIWKHKGSQCRPLASCTRFLLRKCMWIFHKPCCSQHVKIALFKFHMHVIA